MKFILGKKIEMTQIWQGETIVPVTKVQAGPCTILQLKTIEKDGYPAVQIAYGTRRASLITKALRGHFKNFGDFRTVREFRLAKNEEAADLKAGDIITVKTFVPGDKLTVVGTSKGKGFQGVVKRHGFHGQDATHGNKDQLRMSGSVGAGGVQHVFKGMRMGGRMGGDRVTLHDVEVISIDEATNTLLVKGAVPGARNSLVLLSAEGELVTGAIEPVVETPVEETTAEETTPEVVEETPVTEETPAAEEVVTEVAQAEETPVVEEVAPTEEVAETPEAPQAEEVAPEATQAAEEKTN